MPVAIVVALVAAAGVGPPEPAFPGATWERCAPQAVGLSAPRLDAFRDYVAGRGCVVRHGTLAYAWGDIARRADVASACKPWFTHFLFRALEEGKIESVESPVAALEPRLRELNAALGFKDRGIRWRHLACQTSCYGVRERPGEAFDYSDYQIALFADTLFLRVWGATWETVDDDVLHPMLTDLLGCEDRPTLTAFGVHDRPARLAISVRDFARFGLLYLRHGEWNGVRVIRAEHVARATTSAVVPDLPRTTGEQAEMIRGQRSLGGGNNQTDHFGSYSYAWWTNGVDRTRARHWPAAPPDTYGAFGHGGIRAMVILPSLDLVVSWNDARIEGRDMENRALELLVAAVTP